MPPRGLTPPIFEHNVHRLRCMTQLRSKDKSIEKYIYLSQLKDADSNMFYKICLENMSVSTSFAILCQNFVLRFLQEITPLIYTPTVGDACLQYSHIFRRPEGMVSDYAFHTSQDSDGSIVHFYQRQGQCWQGSQELA